MNYDPYAFGQQAARSTLLQDRRRFTVHDGGRRPDAVVPGRSHVTNLRHQHDQAVAAGQPSALPPFDREADPDVPTLPWKVRDALRIVLRSIATPQSETRPNVVMAAALVEQHFRVLPDDAPAHGYPRPGVS